jgi:hypothetical protein
MALLNGRVLGTGWVFAAQSGFCVFVYLHQ